MLVVVAAEVDGLHQDVLVPEHLQAERTQWLGLDRTGINRGGVGGGGGGHTTAGIGQESQWGQVGRHPLNFWGNIYNG